MGYILCNRFGGHTQLVILFKKYLFQKTILHCSKGQLFEGLGMSTCVVMKIKENCQGLIILYVLIAGCCPHQCECDIALYHNGIENNGLECRLRDTYFQDKEMHLKWVKNAFIIYFYHSKI